MQSRWLQRLSAILYPPTCALCCAPGKGNLDICEVCLDKLPRITHACRRCALPFAAATTVELCGSCQQRPPYFDATVAAFHYAPPIDRLIVRLKFNGELTYARLLGELTADTLIRTDADLPEVIIPVPLHAQRMRERGFNQSLELARYIARQLGVPVDQRSVRRVKATQPQMELPAKARKTNVRNAFELISDLSAHHVAIVDDVVTTGSTVNELARVLWRAGAKRIQVWSCARAG